ncbi:MAG TPA: hypothetical protein VGJ15_03775, partial [Pirellulales bacterium]
TAEGDADSISKQLLDQIAARFDAALGPHGQRLASLAVLFLDPVSIGLVDPQGRSFNYNLQTSTVANNLPQTFVEVGGNVEVVVIPNPNGTYQLNVADVAAHSRGGWVLLGDATPQTHLLTGQLRNAAAQSGAASSFELSFGTPSIRPAIGIQTVAIGLTAATETVLASFSQSGSSSTVIPATVRTATSSEVAAQVSTSSSALTDSAAGAAPTKPSDLSATFWKPLTNLWAEINRSLRESTNDDQQQTNSTDAGAPLSQLWLIVSQLFGTDQRQPADKTTDSTANPKKDSNPKGDQQTRGDNQDGAKSASDQAADRSGTGEPHSILSDTIFSSPESDFPEGPADDANDVPNASNQLPTTSPADMNLQPPSNVSHEDQNTPAGGQPAAVTNADAAA